MRRWGRWVELSLAMLVKVRRRARPWVVRWESFAGAMRGDDRHRADTSEGERLACKINTDLPGTLIFSTENFPQDFLCATICGVTVSMRAHDGKLDFAVASPAGGRPPVPARGCATFNQARCCFDNGQRQTTLPFPSLVLARKERNNPRNCWSRELGLCRFRTFSAK